MYPKRKKKHLIVERLPEETLVYDRTRAKAFCLNNSSAVVWKHCDGKTSIGELADILAKDLAVPRSEDLVRLALDRLERAHLVVRGTSGDLGEYRCSRREAVRRFGFAGIAGALIPIVTTLTAPSAASAATCIADADCMILPNTKGLCCCSSRKTCMNPGKCGGSIC